jgi:hypothetical protein
MMRRDILLFLRQLAVQSAESLSEDTLGLTWRDICPYSIERSDEPTPSRSYVFLGFGRRRFQHSPHLSVYRGKMGEEWIMQPAQSIRRKNAPILLAILLAAIGVFAVWSFRTFNAAGFSERSSSPSAGAQGNSLGVSPSQSAVQSSVQSSGSQDRVGSEQILIQYKKPVSEYEKQRLRDDASVVLIRKIDTSYLQMDVVTPTSKGDSALRQAIATIKENPNVEFAEIQQKYSHEPNPH